MLRERERRQPQAGGPAFGALMQQRDGVVGKRDSRRLQQLPRLLDREPQIGAADLGQLAGQAQAMQPEPRGPAASPAPRAAAAAAGRGSARAAGRPRLSESSCRSSMISTAGSSSRRRSDSSCSMRASPRNSGVAPTGSTSRRFAGRAVERVDHRQPEVLRILLTALDRDPCDAVRPGPRRRPMTAGAVSCRCPPARRRAGRRRAPRRTALRAARCAKRAGGSPAGDRRWRHGRPTRRRWCLRRTGYQPTGRFAPGRSRAYEPALVALSRCGSFALSCSTFSCTCSLLCSVRERTSSLFASRFASR